MQTSSVEKLQAREPSESKAILALLSVAILLGLVVGLFEFNFPKWYLLLLVFFPLVIMALIKPLSSALYGLWFVRVEPAPSDLLFAWSIVKDMLQGRFRVKLRVVDLMILCFGLLNILQILLALDLMQAAIYAGKTLYVIILFIYFSQLSRSRSLLSGIKKPYIQSTVIAAGIILALTLLKLANISLGAFEKLLFYGSARPKGFFKDPNVAGPFIVSGLLYFIAEAAIRRRLHANRVIVIMFCLIGE